MRRARDVLSDHGRHHTRARALCAQVGEPAQLFRARQGLWQSIPHSSRPAEACFQQALAIARRQQARSWELRAAVSLSRLWQQQRKPQAAYEVLAPVYRWFTEGFDTADLRDAKALLDVLASCP